MKRIICVLASLAVMVFLSGCASVISGKKQTVTFQSDPSGANVIVNGEQMGTTLLSIPLDRNESNVEFKKAGYEDAQTILTTRLNPWIFLNFLWSYCSTTATTVDYVNGSAYAFDQDLYFISLKPLASGVPTVSGHPSGAETQSETTRSENIRYVLLNYNDISAELAKGDGEHLTALLNMLHMSKAEMRAAAVVKIKELWVKYPNPPDFAKALETMRYEMSSMSEVTLGAGIQSEATRYVLINYNDISAELAKGDGKHLAALLDMLHIPQEMRAATIIKIKELWAKYPNSADFAKALETSLK